MLKHAASPHLSLVAGTAVREVSNAELGRELIAGSAWAIEETWKRFAPEVQRLATRALGVESDADDVVQEVFWRVFNKASTLREPEKLRSFIRTFAVHVIRSDLRGRRAKSWLTFGEPETLVDLPSSAVDVESREILRRFYALLDRLKPRDRLVYALKYFEDMTVEEVAECTELSLSTVKRCLAHASDRLSSWSENDPGISEFLEANQGHR
jgi:RNA polymerase sigma-70 factor (ECF subfamily)